MLIGREKEIQMLEEAYSSDESKFIALYGRRGIGKTFLVFETFQKRLSFHHVGLPKKERRGSVSPTNRQLHAFAISLKDHGYEPKEDPKDWSEAFQMLKAYILSLPEGKKVIFLDELSWMSTPKSDFLDWLSQFWNSWCVGRKDILLIIASSASSWITRNVFHDKGGLHGRLHNIIPVDPFSLHECEEYAQRKGLPFLRRQILETYMVLGGVPYYWSLLKKELSPTQNIDMLFFGDNALLKDEFTYVFAALYTHSEEYLAIVRLLGKNRLGLTRSEIVDKGGAKSGGTLSNRLDDLEKCGFVRSYLPLGASSKERVYQLIDFYCLFYFDFLLKHQREDSYWNDNAYSPRNYSWQGKAFERVCFSHIRQIKWKLGIAGVSTEVYSFFCNKDQEHDVSPHQIDMVIERKDETINLVEMKYTDGPYSIDSSYEAELRKRRKDIALLAGKKYAIQLTIISPDGVVRNACSGILNSTINEDDLFLF